MRYDVTDTTRQYGSTLIDTSGYRGPVYDQLRVLFPRCLHADTPSLIEALADALVEGDAGRIEAAAAPLGLTVSPW